jgi:hypothetical protein
MATDTGDIAPLIEALEKLRNSLLDLTGRNRLLNFREKVTATKSRELAGNRERGCPSFADSPASTVCHYTFAARLVHYGYGPVSQLLRRVADGR